MGSDQGNQLELFELTRQSAPRPQYRDSLGRILLQVRHDQLVLSAMAGMIVLTVVFASGVERGKQLARVERPILARPQLPDRTVERREPVTPTSQVAAAAPAAPTPAVTTPDKPVVLPVTAPVEKKAPAVKAKGGKSRYAVQVVTFSQPRLAKREMDQLRAKGEPAFLVIRESGRTVVYVGPFPSKDNAVEKVSMLRTKYRDCFVKTL